MNVKILLSRKNKMYAIWYIDECVLISYPRNNIYNVTLERELTYLELIKQGEIDVMYEEGDDNLKLNKQEIKQKICQCDMFSILMVTGCKCGGK